MFEDILRGAIISGSLIIAIGAQNLFVLKQGLMRNHIFWVSLICFLCDAILISIGVLGVGGIISQSTIATIVLACGGAIFLLWYGFNAFKSAYKGNSFIDLSDKDLRNKTPLAKIILATLAITLLNPHVYLDTVVIIGGIAGTLSFEQKASFLIGAASASCIWFFGLGYGARLLTPMFRSKRMWQILDIFVGCVMFFIAYGLIRYAISIM
ncbi:LysE/ArgO family amino acid transporter [Zophobihabitans entericus]|uniref:Amino acid transporter n=1 Tax=Zophobihabitans entericus TaxID=1635327 RepID=A0A6G9IEL7_9GAMM|nr:LysE/ArgO family amino acid transporter [Zophobihabitans entericus]QIQ22030.1 amino acid transporter [Zophobihabitans entericus]